MKGALPACLALLFALPVLSQVPASVPPPRPNARGDVEPGANPAAAVRELPFIEDDYAGARARAAAEKKLLFVDAWATWCHTCLSMKRFVLPDPGLAPVKDAVVWLSVETEAETNRDFVEKYPIDGLPTFFLVDPVREEVVARWLGAGTVNELRGFVQGNAAAYAAKRGSAQPPAAVATRRGDLARQRGDLAAAAAAYRKAVRLSDADDPARKERLVLLATALQRIATADARRECAKLGIAEMDHTGDSAVAADFAAVAASCASALPAGEALAARARDAAEARLASLTESAAAPLSVDDRSDAYANLAELQEARGDHGLAVATMKERAALLEAAAQGAPDATLAATFDAHRTDTYLALGEPRKAEELLSIREKQMPADYNPPARLARVLLEEKKLEAAEAAVDRALALMTQGPRRIGILALKARILAAQGKPRGPVLREELAVLRRLPKAQRRPEAEQRLQAELAQLQDTPQGPAAGSAQAR
jgi:tetratricopeptide (TPR) repeat protein